MAEAQQMSKIGSWELDLITNDLKWSDEIFRIFEIDQTKFKATYDAFLNAIHPDDRDMVNAAYSESLANKTPYSIDHRLRMPDNRIKYVQERCQTFYDDEGKPILSTGTVQDITEHTELEETIRRTQKLDALGKLTGGIAHDYNNMLGVILGYTELLKDQLHDQPELEGYVDEIHNASDRGARLTKKLLAFSRLKTSGIQVLNLNTILLDKQDMLEKTLTARIKLVLDLEENLWSTRLDSSDLENAVLNMSINAMHAIDGNGKLTIKTHNQQISEADAQLLGVDKGDYVVFSITDTGCGMDEATKEKIFDPFYSTKGVKGTGLGLSQVYGFIDHCNGAIKVYSELDQGTKFTLYFTRCSEISDDNPVFEDNKEESIKGNEAILIVDDEPALCNLASELLKHNGYNTFTAQSGKEALNIIENESIDLLLSDVIMPEMNGYQLATIVQDRYPGIKIQMVSGFADDKNIDGFDQELQHNLLAKPYNSKALMKKYANYLTRHYRLPINSNYFCLPRSSCIFRHIKI